MKDYREILRELREDRDLKQKDVAQILKISQQHYSKYENGEYDLTRGPLMSLANFYGVSTDYILGRTRCKQGVDGLNVNISDDKTAGDVVSDLLSLNEARRTTVLEILWVQKALHDNEKKSSS